MSAHRNLWQCECVVEMASRDKCVRMNVHVSSPGIAVHVYLPVVVLWMNMLL